MLWIGDKYFSGDSEPKGRVVPRFELAIAAIESGGAQADGIILRHGDVVEGWGFGHDVSVEYADRRGFDDILVFLAASETGRNLLRETPDWRNWKWTPLTENGTVPSTGTAAIVDSIGGVVRCGWVLAEEHGRVDEDTTWCKRTLLFATDTSFVAYREDSTTLH